MSEESALRHEWTSRSRMATAMRLGEPDRVPVMCQLALGHYFLNAGIDPIAIWHGTPEFGEALIQLQRRYGFDGILVNLPGRDPDWRRFLTRTERRGSETHLTWSNGFVTIQPDDDNPHVYRHDGTSFHQPFDEVDPDRLFYVEPHDRAGVTYPTRFGDGQPDAEPGPGFFPPYVHDTIRWVVEHAGDVSVHAEVFSPFSQLMELVGYEIGLLALLMDPGRAKACLDRLTEGAIELANGHVAAGADAVLVSSAFVGAPFLARSHYEEFVLPYERRLAAGIKAVSDVPVYVHTCGAIGDRLDLIMATGIDGIDTLDPPPLGTVDLATARAETMGRVFLKGNLDPVADILQGSEASLDRAARNRIATAGHGGGYILSSACSVPPVARPAMVERLRMAVDEEGTYPIKAPPPGSDNAEPSVVARPDIADARQRALERRLARQRHLGSRRADVD